MLIIQTFYQVQGAVFDLPEEIAKELLNKELPPGNTITKISKVSNDWVFICSMNQPFSCSL